MEKGRSFQKDRPIIVGENLIYFFFLSSIERLSFRIPCPGWLSLCCFNDVKNNFEQTIHLNGSLIYLIDLKIHILESVDSYFTVIFSLAFFFEYIVKNILWAKNLKILKSPPRHISLNCDFRWTGRWLCTIWELGWKHQFVRSMILRDWAADP